MFDKKFTIFIFFNLFPMLHIQTANYTIYLCLVLFWNFFYTVFFIFYLFSMLKYFHYSQHNKNSDRKGIINHTLPIEGHWLKVSHSDFLKNSNKIIHKYVGIKNIDRESPEKIANEVFLCFLVYCTVSLLVRLLNIWLFN